MEKVSCQVEVSERADSGSNSAQSKSSTHLSVVEFSAHWPSFHILDSCMCPGHDHHDGCQVREPGIKLRAVRYHPCSRLLGWSLYPLRCWPPHHLAHCLHPVLPHPFLFLLLVSFTDQPPPCFSTLLLFVRPGLFLTTPCCLSPHHVHMSRRLSASARFPVFILSLGFLCALLSPLHPMLWVFWNPWPLVFLPMETPALPSSLPLLPPSVSAPLSADI